MRSNPIYRNATGIPHRLGTIVYTCMLNAKGGVEADLTVSVMQPSKGINHFFYIK